MDTRLIWESRDEFILRIPDMDGKGGTMVILQKKDDDGNPKWKFSAKNTLSSSVELKGEKNHPRHFIVEMGKIKFCDDDTVAPKKRGSLVPLRKLEVEDVLELLPDNEQTSPLIKQV